MQLFAIIRKADGAFFPIQAGSRMNSHIQFPPVGEPAEFPPRTFVSKGVAKGTLTTWLKGGLYLDRKGSSGYDSFSGEYYDEPSTFKHIHDPARGVAEDYAVVPVRLEII